MAIKYSAVEIARKLKSVGAKVHDPHPDQVRIIESSHLGPAIIKAGAGSGKTETMSARVVWLVANKIVSPDQILGLTFTRKAAGELANRIRTRLRQLKLAGLLETDSESKPIDLAVAVSTYHSYAGRVLSEHGLRLGIDTDTDPIGEAAAWQMANNIISNFDGAFPEIIHTPRTIVKKVLDLAEQLGEHGKDPKELVEVCERWLAKFQAITDGSNEGVRRAVASLKERLEIIPMLERFNEVRLSSGQLTFNDQMAFAAKLVSGEFRKEIASAERAKYKVVLLDEYQDTSYSQVRFLTGLYGADLGKHSVTAVGDPNQSIYGWRGASAGTMAAFAKEFGEPEETKEFELKTTWRNDHAILGLANETIAALKTSAEIDPRFEKVASAMKSVSELDARPGAGTGEILVGQYETMQSEALGIAEHFAKAWHDPHRLSTPQKDRTTFAALVRSKKYIPEIEQALRAQNIPVEVVGLGGLIHVPEVADVIALLRVLIYPDSGSALMRLLVGPHFALGPRDLQGLGQFVRDIAKANGATSTDTLLEVLEKGVPSILEADDFAVGSAIEALDRFAEAPKENFSKVGYERLRKLSQELASLRRRINGSITDALLEAERFLYLDSEVLLHTHSRTGRRHLDQFLDEASKFERTGGTLSMFLEWLKIADDEESGLKVASVDVTSEAVQILTIHAAKGLEWDYVAVPGLVERDFPSSGQESATWTTNIGEIPIEMRGDKHALVDFSFPGGNPNAATVNKALDQFADDVKKLREFEEYRLAYVAFTRAKRNLICSGAWFGQGVKSKGPSSLFELVADFIRRNPNFGKFISEVEKPSGENPSKDNPRTGSWPKVSDRAIQVAKSAEFVASIPAISKEQLIKLNGDIYQDALALLNEITTREEKISVTLPARISVSTLVNLKKDPQALALNIRRPVPNHIDKYARRGTQFHLWLEERFKDPQIFGDEVFDTSETSDVSTEDLPLKVLQEKWLASSWADKAPVKDGVEVPFETTISGVLLRGRIDAVYKDGDQYTVVDWKTGSSKTGDDLEVAAIQLAMYRLAYSKLFKVPIEKISAAFHYVGSNETVRPADLLSQAELEEIITSNLAS